MPKPLPEFVSYVAELLTPLGKVRVKHMFGGFGLYVDELFIAIVADERLFLKVDDETRQHFIDAGCAPFEYEREGQTASLGYRTVPDEAMESPALMQPWARLAISAALRARAAKRAPATRIARPPGAKKTATRPATKPSRRASR